VAPHKERFLGCHSFTTSHTLFVPANVVLKRYVACRTISKGQLCSSENSTKCTCTYKIDIDNHGHSCVCSAFSVQMRLLKIYL